MQSHQVKSHRPEGRSEESLGPWQTSTSGIPQAIAFGMTRAIPLSFRALSLSKETRNPYPVGRGAGAGCQPALRGCVIPSETRNPYGAGGGSRGGLPTRPTGVCHSERSEESLRRWQVKMNGIPQAVPFGKLRVRNDNERAYAIRPYNSASMIASDSRDDCVSGWLAPSRCSRIANARRINRAASRLSPS